ncbi:twin-arginine translocation pathway signal [Rhodococcus sp. CH91]|uniref:twin-arginine translocation pathway signal n=1 Tax=Rhodococcus sp. CH91 TaxID=2910256 RepID=UPI001F4A2CFA|nr:twin-arginine translocation pathway signal [Rhodococcus sp. CH91]
MTDEKDDRVTLAKTTDETVKVDDDPTAGAAPTDDGTEAPTGADTAATAETETEADSAAQTSYLPHVAIGSSVVALVFAVLVGWLAYGAIQESAAESARTEARVAAEEQAVAMLAYTHEEVDAQTEAAAEGLTGDFRDEYTNLMKNIIAPGAKEKAISVQVSVQASSVVSADADSAVTLLFLNQITTSSENPEAVSSGSRVRVELEKHDGRWLVNRLTPI